MLTMNPKAKIIIAGHCDMVGSILAAEGIRSAHENAPFQLNETPGTVP